MVIILNTKPTTDEQQNQLFEVVDRLTPGVGLAQTNHVSFGETSPTRIVIHVARKPLAMKILDALRWDKRFDQIITAGQIHRSSRKAPFIGPALAETRKGTIPQYAIRR